MKQIFHIVPENSLIMLYDTLTDPYLRYCISVWGHCDQGLLNRLQTLQNTARYADANHETLMENILFNSLNLNQVAEYEH